MSWRLLIYWKNIKKQKIKCEFIGRGGAWLDTGSIENFYKTSAFVSAIENQQGFKIACLEEIAYNNKWISKTKLKKQLNFMETVIIQIT